MLQLADKEHKLKIWREQMSAPDFWHNPDRARELTEQTKYWEKRIKHWRQLSQDINALESLALAAKDQEMMDNLLGDLEQLENQFRDLSRDLYLSSPYDQTDAILTINAGAGGVDAQDWAAMLERMYLRFIQNQGWRANYLSRSPGQEAGLKSVTLEIAGAYAYGYLKNEAGVHRLVRLSPFDSDHARHTSFAMVEVLPELSVVDFKLKEEEIKVDTFRSSGHGGQSVNTTDSAVRLTHLPTGITVVCQNERSQLQNKKKAMLYLQSKIQQYYRAEQAEEKKMLKGEYTEASWGNQIRSYVLHPYQLVKDHRSGRETSQTDQVLDGEIMDFIQARLEQISQ